MYPHRFIPLAVAHRGLHTSCPENSLAAFAAAIGAGAQGIELDVHASGDGILFVHHDSDIEMDGARHEISRLDSKTVARHLIDGDAAIPTLDQALELTGSRCDVYVEIKAKGIEETVARCLRRHAPNVERFAVHSFDHRIVKRMLELMPSVRTGILQVSYLVDTVVAMRRAGASDLWQHRDFIDAALVNDVHAGGGRVVAWTSNSEDEWERFAAIGVDAVCTDVVDAYAAWSARASG
jgi:glycerophosphoryl diester phosphodiesterase